MGKILFKPGQSGNPKGRPKGTDHVPAKIRQYNSRIISDIMSKYISMSLEDLDKIINDKTLPAIDVMIARIVATGIKNSDQIKLNFVFERMVGKVPDKIDHTSSDGSMSPSYEDYSKITKDELKTLRDLTAKITQNEPGPGKD